MIRDPKLRALVDQRTPFRDPAATERARAGLPPYIDPPATAAEPVSAPEPIPGPSSKHAAERHPQRVEIINGILAGQSSRSIAKWVKPKLSYAAIASFARSVVRPAARRAQAVEWSVSAALTAPAPTFTPATQAIGANNVKPPDTSLTASLTRAILDADPVTSSEVGKLAIASHEGRVAELASRHHRLKEGLEKVLDERGVEVIRRTRRGSGENATEIEEVRVDPGIAQLAGELLDHEKQAAQELGQWDSGGTPAVAIQIVVPAAPGGVGKPHQVIDIDVSGSRR